MRCVALLVLAVAVFLAPHLNADTILFTDNYGTATETVPAYYVAGCQGGSCNGSEGYAFTVATNTIPATAYIGDPGGNVSDKIVTSVGPPLSCTPSPACLGEFTVVQFAFTSGLDLMGSPFTCASVGGCIFSYNNSVQNLGTITWGPGLFPPSNGFSTTFQFQSLTGTQLTATLTNFQGGNSSDATLLPSGEPVAQVTGTIGAQGSEDFYSFLWAGGLFSATASMTNPPSAGSYLFSEGIAGSCNSGGTQTLNSGDNFTSTIAIADLPAGQYCIGIAATSPNDPGFALTFNTPVTGTGTPEPSGLVFMLSIGLGMMGVVRLVKRGREDS
ncbi:MAG: hypothetical protein ABSE86_11870 [Bryobacteraceae bacterium]